MVKVIFDSAALITSCKFSAYKEVIIEHLLRHCEIFIPSSVSKEVIEAGYMYEDAAIAENLVRSKRIKVTSALVGQRSILNSYKLGKGEKEAITICLRTKNKFDFLITDDKLAYIVSDRVGIKKMLLLDLIVELTANKLVEKKLARKIIKTVSPRYSKGFVEHTLFILEKGERKCLV